MQDVAIVTGGTGFLGRAVAKRFSDDGYRVHLTAASEAELRDYDGPGEVGVVDLTSLSQTRDWVAGLGSVKACALVAGGFSMKNLDQLEEADFDAMFDLNVRTATNTLTAVSDALVKGGAAVLVGSRAAVGAGGMSLYAASKAAVVALARSAALEWRHRGIRVNCILPDTIDTPANRKAMPDADFTRWAKPEQVAAVIAFLCSDSGTIITGAAIPVGYSVA